MYILFTLLIFIPLKLSSFIIQADQLEKNGKEIILYSDLHLPELPNSKQKQKNQNKILKNKLKQDKNQTVLFEGYKQDQKQKFSKEQIKRSKHLTTPAYLDTLTQTLNNPKIKIIPADPRKNINEAFIKSVKTIELLSNDYYETVLEGCAKIKKLNQQEKSQLIYLQKACPSFNLIFNDTKKLKNTLSETKKQLRFCCTDDFNSIYSKTIVEIISDILLNHYTILEKPYKDKLKIIMNNLITIYEKSFELFDNKLFTKAIKSKDNKILIFAGQEHIENVKNMFLKNGFKIKKEIYDSNTIKTLNNLDKQIENGSLKNLENELEKKAQSLKLPNEAFDLIIQCNI